MNSILLSEFLSLLKGKKVLDVGAGSGEVSASLYELGFNVTAIDFSSDSYDKLIELPIESVKTDLFDFFPSKRFDGVLFLDVIHLFPKENWEKLMLKLMSFLSKEGLLLFSAPLLDSKDLDYLFNSVGLKIVNHKVDSVSLASGKKWHYWIVVK